MARGSSGRVRVAASILALVITAVAVQPVHAQAAVGYAESPADALARNMKVLGRDSTNFEALIGAGRAALAMGDTQAAGGFFGRADEVWPASPLGQAGMGAAMAQSGDGIVALQCFARAVQRGATQSMIGADRGLAYDLLGQHAQAQADYRAALLGRDGDEARRRLALSLAITGKNAEALSTLSGLMRRGDAAAGRTRAFVLALTGDVPGARAAIDAAMPGSSAKMGYFFQKLASLRSDQKAAAVNLGIFPDSAVQVASATPRTQPLSGAAVSSSAEDRIKSIQDWLSDSPNGATAAREPVQEQAQQVASVLLPTRVPASRVRTDSSSLGIYSSPKLWLQLASGGSASSLPAEFDRLKRKSRDLFDGISGYVFDDGGRARLLIGPFRSEDDAEIFADDLASIHIDAFTWTSQPGQTIRKLPSE
jgi:tetratricopeptide (TPR) repeat protein